VPAKRFAGFDENRPRTVPAARTYFFS